MNASRQLASFVSVLSLALLSGIAQARVSPEEAARLDQSLTPLGGERMGNGQEIPDWTGGLPQEPMERGDNPFAADQPLFVITGKNYQQHAERLTAGKIALFKAYPDSYKMPVYPTRRSASFPTYIYEATRKNAEQVELTNEGFGFCCTAQGFPFPIPGNGTEAIWNHVMRYNTKGYRGYLNHAVTTPDGDYVVERSFLELSYHYNHPEATLDSLNNQNLWLFTKVVAPPNKAGDAHLIHVPIDRIAEETGVWVFNPGLGRTRRIGKVGYDNPAFDGLMTHDQIDMFNGPLDRYTVKLLGKREMYVPYNAYSLYSDKVEYDDIIDAGHINQELTRYELHRVWVIEANVRDGFKHIYKKRTFYLDEDSWLVLLQDMYDELGNFWRTAEAHAITFQNVPLIVNGVQVHYDIQSRRYVILNMTNEEREAITYDWYKPRKYFNPRELKKFALP